ncbi:MAG: hypothetical protein R3Y56_04435 [Akkermansia sp.]
MTKHLCIALSLLALSPCEAHANTPLSPSDIHITLSDGEPAQQARFNAAYQSLLLGHQEAARTAFEQCIAGGLNSPLAHVGLILSNIGLGQNKTQGELEAQSRQHLASLTLDTPITPQEERYLNAFSLLLTGQQAASADAFAQYAQQYRADIGLTLWAIQLLHEGYNEDGTPTAPQQRAIQLADELLARSPDKALAQLARALVEENAPQVSPQALAAAQQAADMLPTEPMAALLHAHLLARSGQLAAAEQQLAAAEQRASAWQGRHDLHWRENSPWVRARLYRITLLHQMGQEQQSQKLLQDTLQRRLPISAKYAGQPATLAEILYHWELKTLALRLLIASGEKRSHKQHKQLLTKANSGKRDSSFAGYSDYTRCLYETLEARLYHHEQNATAAQNALQRANQLEESLRQQWTGRGSYATQSSTTRAAEACSIATNLVRCDMFETTRDLWQEKLQREMRPSSLLMPPIIPVESKRQSNIEPPTKAP